MTITYSNEAQYCALLEEFFTTNGCTLAEGGKQVNVSLVASIDGAYDYELHGYENEAYTLDITAEHINITAVTATGIIRAAQTLTQLAEGYAEGETKALEALTMKDWPAFKLRGYMHDVGRSFISTDELVKQIELFSRFKVNTFHWHLTENQAWRFEVKAYPELTADASMTRFPGQYYTQEDCKRVMQVAKKHGVIVIPEIDMPGHSEAFERAMHFNMQSEEGKVALKKILDEVVEVFAGAPYIHIGGDEVSTTAAYLNEMIAYAESKGANVKGGLWNPINGIGQDALNNTLAQMWGTRGYLASGKANIDCRYNYTNHFDVFADLVGIYKSTIYYSQQGSAEVAGAISGCWNDRKVADENAIMAQNNVWANVIATAERAWMGGGKQYIDNATNTPDAYKTKPYGGGVMLPNSGEEYEEFKSWETRFLFHKANSLKNEPIPYVKQTNVRWRITDAFPNGGDKAAAFGPEEAGMTASTDLLPEVFTHEGKTYYTGMATGAGIYLAHTWGNSIINAYYSNPQFNHTAYAWTYVYSDKEQKVGAQIEFQNYSRSEQDAAPAAKKWDFYDSKIWINGEEIAAPTWDNTGVNVSNKEVELKNENFAARKPIEVTLKQGWNKVFLKLPYMNEGCRLKKWMFTCVFTDTEGKNAVEGLIYSPNQCMDEATEAVAAKVSEIKRDRGNLIGTTIGLWDASLAETLDDKVTEIEATYSASKTAEERAAQVAALEEAWATFVASLTEANMNKPVSGNYYRMYTPQRENRYPTGQGTDMAIIGEQNPTTNASIWQFVSRGDGSYDIINSANNTYIATSGDPLKCVTTRPNAGWTLKPASTNGLVILTCGTAQFNQGNSGASYKINNWGSGTNTTDGGCQYAFVEAEPIDRLMYNVSDGQYNERTSSDWRNGWTSTNEDKPTLAISVSANNMNAGSSEYIGMRPGQSGSSIYTLTLGEYFTNYSFEAKSTNASANHKITINGETTAVGTEWVTFTVDVNSNTTKFKLEGGNDNDFYIRNIKFVQEVTDIEKFANGGVYTFVTARGTMGATESNTKVISTARTSVSDTNTDFFKWTVYKSTNGNYYLYNLGKQQFMGMQTANNTEIDFVTTPAGRKLTFKQSSSADYPIMLSTDNAGVVNHSTNHGGGLINWTGGWNTLNDEGSNHQVTLVGILDESKLATIANLVEAYDKTLPVKAEVIGLGENNPNTHFGSVRATSASGSLSTKLKTANINEVAYVDYDGTQETTIDFTREYRGFEFQGYWLGSEELGKSFTLTDDQKNNISADNPIVAKFTTTDEVTLFYDDDEFSYRIPAIGKTSTGRLIAVSDYRHCLDDIGMNRWGKGYRIDLVIRTSDDNGKTWSTKKTIAEGIDNSTADNCAYGDAAIAIVGNEVIVMAVAGSTQYGTGNANKISRLVRVYSSDNGDTWEKTDITEKVYGHEGSLYPTAYTAFFGSGKLAVDPNYNESDNARIYGSLLAQGHGNHVIYSDDKGLTWSNLGGQVANANEPKVEILPNGQLLFSARRVGGRNFNVFTYTNKTNNEGSWASATNGCDNGGSNGTNGDIILIDAKNVNGENVKLLLQSQPAGGTNEWDRRDVSIWYKEINGNTYTPSDIATGWSKGLQVSNQLSAYSAMSLQEDGRIAFFFEEAPCYADRNDWGYCMVYMPLTIENITKGNYFSKDAILPESVNVNVILTDEQGNTYNNVFTCALNGIESTLTTNYPFITLGTDKSLSTEDGNTYTYTNTVTLPFKVSNSETTVWHNIYWPANGNSTGYPVYLSASAADDTYVPKVTESAVYGNSTYNTAESADKISWAMYNVGDGFTFKFKNKLTGKFIQATDVANANKQNVVYVDEANATAFELVPDEASSYMGDYALKASINSSVGYLCSTSATGYHYATHYNGSGHQGAWVKFVEVPDFTTLIASINEALTSGLYGNSLGQYKPTGEITLEAISEAMKNSGTIKLNTLNSYKELFDGATLNMPKAGQYFRVAYDYGGNVGKLYMQGVASTVKGVAFTAETGNASVWVFHNGALYSYTAGQNLREHGNDRGLSDTKTEAGFSASTRAKGKYNIQVGSFIHANNSNGNYYTDHCSGNNCAQHDLILEEVDMRPSTIVSTISEHKIATFYANEAVVIPDGIKAYVATNAPVMNDGTGTITMTELEGIIPAKTGVVICGEAGEYTFAPAESVGTPVEGNMLVGYAGVFEHEGVALPADGSTTYVLAVEDEKAGFYKKENAFEVYYNKAYLKIPTSVASARSLVIRFDDEESTDIKNSEITNQNSEIFDLQGRRVLNPTKGIYIVNGKKVIVK